MVHDHRTIKQLSEEANNYEYSETVPVKVYLRTADTISRHADLYKDAKSYDDAYILYVRFLDLLMNKMSRNPQLKKGSELYKSYLSLVNEKAPLVLKNAEIVKNILVEHLSSHERYLAVLEDNKKKSLEREKRLAQEESSGDIAPEVDSEFDEIDEDRLNGQLSSLLKESPVVHLPSSAYPTLPKHHELASTVVPTKQDSIISEKIHSISSQLHLTHKNPEHKTLAYTEGGKPLKTVYLPSELHSKFLSVAEPNTKNKLETCGILCGKLSLNAFFITTLVIPEQESTENTCQTNDEESLFEYVDKNDLFVLGWIHTHPTQSCFLSSVDLHTQNSYQIMLPEAMAIVCAPSAKLDFGVFRLTDPPGVVIVTKCQRSGFHPHNESDIYKRGEKLYGGHVVTKDHLPFACVDLRKKP